MKKLLTVAIAVVVIALSVLPAFADSVQSPTAKPTSYVVTIDDADVVGGHVVADYKTGIDEDGKQVVVLTGVPDEGYVFIGWIIDGEFVPEGSLTDAQLELVISGDITVKPYFAKKGSPEATDPHCVPTDKGDKGGKTIDGSSKSPQTGSQDVVAYIILGASVVALAAVVITAKRRSAEK